MADPTPTPTWTPSNPGGLARDTPLDTNPDQYQGTLAWESTPPTSHVSRWKHYDARKYSFLRRFGPDESRGASQIVVRFRDKKNRETAEYKYYIFDHDRADYLAAAMRTAAHPGAFIPDLEAAANASGGFYQKQGAF